MGCKSVLFFYGCLKLRFPDVEVNSGPRVAPQCCRVMFTNINGLHGNRDELAIAATKFDVVACAETKVTGRRHVSERLLPGFKAPTLLLRGARPNGLGIGLFVRSGLSVSRRGRFDCSCCEFMVAKIPGQRLNCYLFVVYWSPSTDNRVFDCLCEAMGSIQSVDPKSVFCFVGDFNCHHSEWLGSLITDAHGVAAFDFATVADCSQLVNGPTHRAGGVLDLVLTNVPDLCNVHVHGNVGRSDHASLGVALNLSPAVAGFDVARRVPLKSRVNWNAVCEALSGLNWRSIFRSPTMVRDFDREVSGIMERFVDFVPMVTVRRGGDAAWFDGDCRLELLSWSSQLIIVGAGTVLLRTGIYSAKHEELLIDSMRLRRLVTLRIAVGTLMTVPLPMPGGVH